MEYFPTIGLEIHTELKTRTKMFCDSRNDPDEMRPNVNVCPVCLGHPGTLPVINKEAVRKALLVGAALNGTIADFTEFDRKNYFYPDIPKGYQISQYKHPLVTGGTLNGVAITRVHLEEDTATSIHESGTMNHESSLIDFNRAGVPLMELVTEPVIHSANEAGDFARELQLLLRYLGVSDADMEKGEMRVEANVSVTKNEKQKTQNLGTKVEIKNLNSFRAVERAIEYEIKRQAETLESGGAVIQETRGWDDAAQSTFAQRRKEESHDYRYFPDPDLPKLRLRLVPGFAPEALAEALPELPVARRERLAREFGIKKGDAELFTVNRALGDFFEEAAKRLKQKDAVLLAANYIASDIMGLLRRAGAKADSTQFAFGAAEFSELMRMIEDKKISSRGAKDILSAMFEKGGEPGALALELCVLQKSDARELEKVVSEIISVNPESVQDYKKGKQAAMQFLVGQGMKATKGAANPSVLRELFAEQLQ